MVSQSSSVGYTIMGKTADLTVVQKTTIDTLHKEGKTQKVIAKEAGCSQSSVSKHINREAKGRKRCGRKKCTSNRDNRTLERIVKQNPFKNVGRFTKTGLQLESVLQEPLRTDVCKTWVSAVAFLVSSHSWTTDSVRSVSPGLKTKRTGLLLSGPKLCSLMKVNFAFPLEIRVPRVWRKRGEAQNPRCLRSSVKFPQSVMVWGAMSSAGVGPLCFLRSKVNTAVYQEVLEHFMLPAADQLYGDADFIFQQDLAPAHSAKATSTWFKDHGIPVLNWPANSPDLVLWRGRCDMPDPTMQKSWRPLSEQPGLS